MCIRDRHDWPAWLNPATLSLAAAPRQSPSASTMTGLLLPSSRLTFLRGAFSRMAQPTGGLPPGWLNVVTGSGGAVGDPLVLHDGVAMITFTGSPHSSSSRCA